MHIRNDPAFRRDNIDEKLPERLINAKTLLLRIINHFATLVFGGFASSTN